MNRIVSLALASTLSSVFTLSAGSAMAADVQELLDIHCGSCHGNEVYTRPDHRMQNREQLARQLERCDKVAGTRWDDKTKAEVLDYLATKFYKF